MNFEQFKMPMNPGNIPYLEIKRYGDRILVRRNIEQCSGRMMEYTRLLFERISPYYDVDEKYISCITENENQIHRAIHEYPFFMSVASYDAVFAMSWINNKDLVEKFGRNYITSLWDEEVFLSNMKSDPNQRMHVMYSGLNQIGFVGIHDIDEDGCGYLGLTVNPAHQGQGWGSEMLHRLLEENSDCKIVATPSRTNGAMITLLKRHGFEETDESVDYKGRKLMKFVHGA